MTHIRAALVTGAVVATSLVAVGIIPTHSAPTVDTPPHTVLRPVPHIDRYGVRQPLANLEGRR